VKPNLPTPEGRALGREIARLCDTELAGKRDDRCPTCAFRAGEHIANGSPETLMEAVKCLAEGEPFWCHEHDRACAGWVALRFPKDGLVKMPWEYCGGVDSADGVTPTERFAPEGKVWVCGACGKRTKDRYGEEGGWDEACMLNAVLCDAASLILGSDGCPIRAIAT
jgi:hypothetical protein